MICSACQHQNRAGRKFCSECGAALALPCAACGAASEPGEKFCGECGAKLVESRPSRVEGPPATPTKGGGAETRKIVTILFADLAGSTALHERLDPESVRRFMESYYEVMRAAVEAQGGTVVKFLGDGVMAAFGVPHVAEDDALRAVHAGVAMQQAFRGLARAHTAIGLRVAINTGEVVVSADNTDVVGDPVNVAARLQQEARDGEVVVGESTRRLVAALATLEPLGSFTLKGRSEAVKAYRVASLDRPAGAAAVPFVGREEELGRLNAVYDGAVAKPAARLAVLLGSPGLGKSRLIDEFGRRLGDAATVILAQCDVAGGATFAPPAEALREFLHSRHRAGSEAPFETPPKEGGSGRTDGELLQKSNEWGTVRAEALEARGGVLGQPAADQALHVAIEAVLSGTQADRTRIINGIAALLAGSPASPEETFFVIRRFLGALAQHKPVVLVIDDLQWAEPLLLDLVEHLIQWGSGVPLFVMVGARPELRELRSALVTPGGLVSDVVTLSGLDAGAATRLAANVIGATDLPAAVAAKVLATSEGNPLFVGELVRMLVDEGVLERQGERWVVGANLAAFEMPPTIHALLAARIERLQPEERTVLERAAVVGRHFSRSAVAALLRRYGSGSWAGAHGELPELDARLETLRRRELIERDTGWFLGEPVLRFHHVLIRDAAYRRLLKGTRAELHARLADWIEAQVKEASEHDETIGWHLEQAHQLLRELGPLDAKGTLLGERAAQRLAAAGRRALARDDVPVAADLLGRAIDRLDADDPVRADLALDWCEALLSAGDVGAAAKAIAELARNLTTNNLTTNNLSRLSAWHTCFTGQLTVLTAPQELQATADAVATAAEEFAKLGDVAGEAKAHFVQAQALARLGRVGACEAALDKALAAARKAGDRRRANAVLAGAPLAALWGPSPVTRASGRCLDVVRVLRITQGAPAVEAVALSCQGVLEALRGRTDAARRMIASARKMVEELGIAHRLFEADVFAGRIDLLEDDAVSAERTLRGAYDGLRDLGLGIDAARAGALLARAQLTQGKVAEAETSSQESEALAGDDLQAAIAWRGVRAEALARRGDTKAAVELAQAAVAIAAATDALLDHADARLALAAALRAAGRVTEADTEERSAIELWEAKGVTLSAQRVSRSKPSRSPLPLGEARARFEELAARGFPLPVGEGAHSARRRVRLNAATAVANRYRVAALARDMATIEALTAPEIIVLHHPTGAVIDHSGAIRRWRILTEAEGLAFREEPIATLGDSLALGWDTTSLQRLSEDGLEFGASESIYVNLFEINKEGLAVRVEVFATDHLGDAIARLYERYAEQQPEGPERDRAAAVARSVAVGNAVIDPERLAAVFAPSIECVDHRPLHTWSSRGADEFLGHWREQTDLASGFAGRHDDVLVLTPDAFLVRQTYSGNVRATGGHFENVILALFAFGRGGLIARVEVWEPGCEAEALARFDELTGFEQNRPPLPRGDGRGVDVPADRPPPGPLLGKEGGPITRHETWDNDRAAEALARFDALVGGESIEIETPGAPGASFANAATKLMAQQERVWAARDWEARVASYLPTYQLDDRRRLMRMQISGEAFFTQLRMLFDLPRSRWHFTPLATRGERLALGRVVWEGDVDETGGPLVAEYLEVFEVDAAGRCAASALFDPDELDAAYAELDRRFGMGEGAVDTPVSRWWHAFERTFRSRDWAGLTALCSPNLLALDHRLVGWEERRGPTAWVQTLQMLVELAPDSRLRADHLRISDRGALFASAWVGTRDGGAFESPVISVAELDEAGKLLRLDLWDPDKRDEAFARFAQLGRYGLASKKGAGGDRLTNAATRARAQVDRCFMAKDWNAMRALASDRMTFEDRRHWAMIRGDAEMWVKSLETIQSMSGVSFDDETIATVGERIGLHRRVVRGRYPDAGQFEGELLLLTEVDADGKIVASINFDLEASDAAFGEAQKRFLAGEGAPSQDPRRRR